MESKIATYIGFAIKANKVKWGIDNITEKRARAKIILIDSSLSERSKRNIVSYALSKMIKLIELKNLAELTNRKEAKAIGIYEKNLAEAIEKIIEGVKHG